MLRIKRCRTLDLPRPTLERVIELCDAAFEEPTGAYLATIGPGEHLLGWEEDRLVAHLMWVSRELQVGTGPLLRTAYVEMVATAPAEQRRGHATRILEAFPPLASPFDIAALSPATNNLYLRLGWRFWRGPLSHRRDGALILDPDDTVMILPTPHTPHDLDVQQPLSVEWRPGEVW